jgi:hypothetical protein
MMFFSALGVRRKLFSALMFEFIRSNASPERGWLITQDPRRRAHRRRNENRENLVQHALQG